MNRIWHNYAVDRVHVDTDWICYSFRVFEPVSVTDRYRLTKSAEQAAKMSLTAWMRERSFYYETDSLVACHFELEHLDVYMARTLNGVSVMEDIRKRTQHWKYKIICGMFKKRGGTGKHLQDALASKKCLPGTPAVL